MKANLAFFARQHRTELLSELRWKKMFGMMQIQKL